MLMSLQEIVPILQIAVGPVILISGVGLLLLSMTNRFGRIIDRSRQLGLALRGAPQEERAVLVKQVELLSRRAGLLRRAVFEAGVSLLCAAALVMTIFCVALLGLNLVVLIGVLFIACLIALILSLVAFLKDMNLSLVAFHMEIEADLESAGVGPR